MRLPLSSAAILPIAATGTGTWPFGDGKIAVPVRVNPQLPAAVSVEQPFGASAWTMGNAVMFFFSLVPQTTRPTNAAEATSMVMIRFMSDLLLFVTKARTETTALCCAALPESLHIHWR